MAETMTLTDGHCHLANLNSLLPLEPLMAEATQHGISRWLSSALTRAEVRYYLDHLQLRFSAGIHPNYPECDLDLSDVAALCSERKIWAVGEIGLDRNGPPIAKQEELLVKQLELASGNNLPVVLHIVGHQQRAYEILKTYPLRYLVHGYAGSIEGFRLLARLDSWFTVSERILRPDKQVLLREMVSHGRYLAETDITRHYVAPDESNPLLRLLYVVQRTCELAELSWEEFRAAQDASYTALTEHIDG